MTDPFPVTDPETERKNGHSGGVLAGVLIGAAAGATAMLLLAPRSGSATREQIRKKGLELRDRAGNQLDEAVQQARSAADSILNDGRRKAAEVKRQGLEALAGQLDRVAAGAQAARRAVRGS